MSTTHPTTTLVEVDTRRRVTLGRAATHDRYIVREEAHGVLVLEPAVVISAAQAALNAHPEVAAAIVDSIDNRERGVPRVRRAR